MPHTMIPLYYMAPCLAATTAVATAPHGDHATITLIVGGAVTTLLGIVGWTLKSIITAYIASTDRSTDAALAQAAAISALVIELRTRPCLANVGNGLTEGAKEP